MWRSAMWRSARVPNQSRHSTEMEPRRESHPRKIILASFHGICNSEVATVQIDGSTSRQIDSLDPSGAFLFWARVSDQLRLCSGDDPAALRLRYALLVDRALTSAGASVKWSLRHAHRLYTGYAHELLPCLSCAHHYRDSL